MSTSPSRRILVGVGNAGVTVLDLLSVECPGMTGLLAVNNDRDSLNASIVREKIEVPEGDLGEGFRAIDEEFGRTVEGASAVILCGGLGGETGSFLLTALAIRAKSAGLTTMACVGMPFSFEGKHKRDLAERSLEKLQEICDAVLVIGNDQLSGGSPSIAAVGEAFVLSDRTLLAALLALTGMLSTSGPVKITRADIHNVLGKPGVLTHFGFGKAEGSNRLHESLERALKSPLLTIPGKGSTLKESSMILLLLRGAKDISFAEVQAVVGKIEQIAGDNCQIKVGVHADGPLGSPLELYLLASSGGTVRKPAKPSESNETGETNSSNSAISSNSSISRIGTTGTIGTKLPQSTGGYEMPPEHSEGEKGTGELFPNQTKPASKFGKKAATASKQMQGTLALDTYQRGRFDKSEPTIVEGEDLDVPTFLRKGIKLNTPTRK
jgi:cell division protein FtsZ